MDRCFRFVASQEMEFRRMVPENDLGPGTRLRLMSVPWVHHLIREMAGEAKLNLTPWQVFCGIASVLLSLPEADATVSIRIDSETGKVEAVLKTAISQEELVKRVEAENA